MLCPATAYQGLRSFVSKVADCVIWMHAYIDSDGSVMTLFFEFCQVWQGVGGGKEVAN
jgi:hypothetical protein